MESSEKYGFAHHKLTKNLTGYKVVFVNLLVIVLARLVGVSGLRQKPRLSHLLQCNLLAIFQNGFLYLLMRFRKG